jgi:transcriptional regulator GlxA family with amidase domain
MKAKRLILLVGILVGVIVIIGLSRSFAMAQLAQTPETYVCPPCGTDCHNRSFDKPGTCPVCGMTLVKESSMKKVAIFLYDGVELLDFSGPGEVFAASTNFKVYTVSVDGKEIVSQGFLHVKPDYSLEEAPRPDILILPGGGTGPSQNNVHVINWIKSNVSDNQVALSVCTGAFLLAKAGLLDGKTATTWYGAIDRFRQAAPKTKVLENIRFVDNGNIITTAGVSAGIDGALHLVERIHGPAEAKRVAQYMEYDKWVPENGVVVSN